MRLFTRSALTIAALTFTATAAEAATTDANTSKGTADFSWSTRKGITGPTSDKIGGSTIAAEFSADLDPVKDVTKPLLSVAMKQVAIEARWSDDKTIELAAIENKATDGNVKIEHTLAPHLKVHLDLPVFGKFTYDYNAEKLIDDLPGSNFNYLGTGTGDFTPWAFTNTGIVNVKGPALADAQLVSKKLEDILFPNEAKPLLSGVVAFNATTEPTFNYTTTEVTVSNQKLTKDKQAWSIPTVDADYLDIPTTVKGQVAYSGKLRGRPSVTITKAQFNGISIPLNLVLDIPQAGVELPYESGATPIVVEFPAQTIHIPLPNVKCAANGVTLDLGDATVGERLSKTTEIKNTGEREAVLSIKSSNPKFKVLSDKVINAKEKFDLEIAYTPDEEGPATADITVTSNDPDKPVQVIKVSATGNAVAVPAEAEEEEYAPRADSGCGCRTTPTSSSYAGFGLLGLAVVAFVRRRRH